MVIVSTRTALSARENQRLLVCLAILVSVVLTSRSPGLETVRGGLGVQEVEVVSIADVILDIVDFLLDAALWLWERLFSVW
jgi:hypothetical protein